MVAPFTPSCKMSSVSARLDAIPMSTLSCFAMLIPCPEPPSETLISTPGCFSIYVLAASRAKGSTVVEPCISIEPCTLRSFASACSPDCTFRVFVITPTPAAATTAITISTSVAIAGDTPRLSFNRFLFLVFIFFVFTSYSFNAAIVHAPALLAKGRHLNHHDNMFCDALYRSCPKTICGGK